MWELATLMTSSGALTLLSRRRLINESLIHGDISVPRLDILVDLRQKFVEKFTVRLSKLNNMDHSGRKISWLETYCHGDRSQRLKQRGPTQSIKYKLNSRTQPHYEAPSKVLSSWSTLIIDRIMVPVVLEVVRSTNHAMMWITASEVLMSRWSCHWLWSVAVSVADSRTDPESIMMSIPGIPRRARPPSVWASPFNGYFNPTVSWTNRGTCTSVNVLYVFVRWHW